MGDENSMDSTITDLDLNQQPVDSPLPSVALNELETTHMRIEERIRQLQGVTARARLRQRERGEQSSMEITHVLDENLIDIDAERVVLDGINSAEIVSRTVGKGKGCKRDSSHLVAKALEMESEFKKADKKADKEDEGGSFYDCRICLDLARDPVLTCCGHLFCWSCFYQVSDVDSTSKECPVCKGEVSDSTIIPIYGNGDSEHMCETVNGLMIPPRPKARRVESVRQQQVTRGMSHVPVAEALRRIRMSIGGVGIDMESQLRQTTETAGSHHFRIHQVSRVLSESAASLTSLSSALSNAERLVEDLETVISNGLPRIDPPASSVDGGNRIIMHSAGIQSDNQLLDPTADLNATLPRTSLLQLTNASGPAVRSWASRTSTGNNPTVTPRYSLRSRSFLLRFPNQDRQDTPESGRRRLN